MNENTTLRKTWTSSARYILLPSERSVPGWQNPPRRPGKTGWFGVTGQLFQNLLSGRDNSKSQWREEVLKRVLGFSGVDDGGPKAWSFIITTTLCGPKMATMVTIDDLCLITTTTATTSPTTVNPTKAPLARRRDPRIWMSSASWGCANF